MISLLYIFNKFLILYLFLLLYHLTTLVFKAMDHVICCVFLYRDLESSSKDGLDTYISLMLLPDKTKATKRKTSVKKRDLNPEYNERCEMLYVCVSLPTESFELICVKWQQSVKVLSLPLCVGLNLICLWRRPGAGV